MTNRWNCHVVKQSIMQVRRGTSHPLSDVQVVLVISFFPGGFWRRWIIFFCSFYQVLYICAFRSPSHYIMCPQKWFQVRKKCITGKPLCFWHFLYLNINDFCFWPVMFTLSNKKMTILTIIFLEQSFSVTLHCRGLQSSVKLEEECHDFVVNEELWVKAVWLWWIFS